jgi:soluble lytic murein transglycosylase-like protein
MKHWLMGGENDPRGAPEWSALNERRAGGLRRRATVTWRDRVKALPLTAAAMVAVPLGALVLAAGSTETMEPVAPSAEESAGAVEGAFANEVPDDAVARAWRKRMLERERDQIAEQYARDFSISPALADKIVDAALTHEIEPQIAFGLVRAESSFRRTVVSHAGAVGYTQLLPSTARWIAPGTTRAALFNTETNLDVGFRYLRYLKDKYDGDVDLALTAYNRGQGRVDSLLRAGRNPDNGYAMAVRTGQVSRTLIRQNSPRG